MFSIVHFTSIASSGVDFNPSDTLSPKQFTLIPLGSFESGPTEKNPALLQFSFFIISS
jgi:hypothetical protein